MVSWNLKFNSQNDVKKIRKNAKDSDVSITGSSDIRSSDLEIDKNSLIISAESKEIILSFLARMRVSAKVISS